MNKNKLPLFDDYSVEISTDEKEFMNYFIKNRDIVFSGNSVFHIDEILNKNEKEKLSKINKKAVNFYKLRLYILKGNTRIGWFLGEQLNRETFYMRNTGIFEEFRGKGIYKSLLSLLIGILKEKGFQKITSSHIVTNNHVIVAKLKAGFLISGFELSDRFGLFVNLTYNFNEIRNKIMRYRAGEIAIDKQLTQLLNFNKNK